MCTFFYKANAEINFDNSLINYLLTPTGSSAAAQNPAIAAQCFSIYLPNLSEVANNYSVQYQACLTLANEQRTNLTNDAVQKRATLSQKTNDICTAYQTCNNLTGNLESLNCYATVVSNECTTTKSYTIIRKDSTLCYSLIRN